MTSPIMVGREEELGRLVGALERARKGRPGTVLIGGEAGVGKTRLIEEFQSIASGNGCVVLVGGCLDLGEDPLPFGPITAALRRLANGFNGRSLAELGEGLNEVSRLLPELGVPVPGTESKLARARLFEHLLLLLGRLAGERPVALVVEDAHWADPSTLALILFLARNLQDERVLLVMTFRSDELHRRHPLRLRLTELGRLREVERVDLSRLDREHTTELLRVLIGTELDTLLADRVFSRSEGNPLFVETMVSCRDQLERLDDSLRDLLLRNAEGLPDRTRKLLRVMSAGGQHVGHRLLDAVAGGDSGELSEALRPAIEAHVVHVVGEAYAFRHALIREAIHEELLPGEHGRWHEAYAIAIESDPSLVPPGRAAVEAAHHWYSSHVADRALASAWHAANAAQAAAAFDEELLMLERVLELWDRVPDAAEVVAWSHSRVLQAAALAADHCGELERGVRLITAALERTDGITDPETTAVLLNERARMRRHLGDDSSDDIEEARRLITPLPSGPARVRVLYQVAKRLAFEGRPNESESLIAEVLSQSRELGDEAAERDALGLVGIHRAEQGDEEAALRTYAELRRLGEPSGSPGSELTAIANESDILQKFGRFDRAYEVAKEGVELARQSGLSRTLGAFMSINVAEPLVFLGRWDEAETTVRRTLELDPPPNSCTYLRRLLGDILVERGDIVGARTELQAATKAAGTRLDVQIRLPLSRLDAALALAEGHPERAVSLVLQGLESGVVDRGGHHTWPCLGVAATALVAAWKSSGSGGSQLTGPATRLTSYADRLAVHGDLQRAWALLFSAEIARIQGHHDPAAWDSVVRAWDAVAVPFHAAYARVRAAEALAASDRATAEELLSQALRTAKALRAEPLLRQIERSAAGSRIRTIAPADAHPELPAGLTVREVEVLKLIAAGRTNAEIAAALFIARKTASVHVSHILSKLKVARRGEAAAPAHRLGLLDS